MNKVKIVTDGTFHATSVTLVTDSGEFEIPCVCALASISGHGGIWGATLSVPFAVLDLEVDLKNTLIKLTDWEGNEVERINDGKQI